MEKDGFNDDNIRNLAALIASESYKISDSMSELLANALTAIQVFLRTAFTEAELEPDQISYLLFKLTEKILNEHLDDKDIKIKGAH